MSAAFSRKVASERLNAPNREAWLAGLVEAWRPTIAKVGELPKLRIACGFPSKRARARNRAIGECWPSHRSADGTIEVFVSPVLDDAFQIAKVALHELLHAVVGCEHGHRGPFNRAMACVGLVGPARATVAGDELAALIRGNILPELGPYPHSRLDPTGTEKQQKGRMIKAFCEACGCTIRLPRKWIVRPCPPLCACNGYPMVVEWGSR